jgi:hypothetical protein
MEVDHQNNAHTTVMVRDASVPGPPFQLQVFSLQATWAGVLFSALLLALIHPSAWKGSYSITYAGRPASHCSACVLRSQKVMNCSKSETKGT